VNRHHVFYWEYFTEGLLGWASARTGDLDKGLTRLQRSWEIRARMQTRIWGSYFRISEADILVQNQRNDEPIALLDRVAADATGPRFDDAEGCACRPRAAWRRSGGTPDELMTPARCSQGSCGSTFEGRKAKLHVPRERHPHKGSQCTGVRSTSC
jgi:hypothetical protein